MSLKHNLAGEKASYKSTNGTTHTCFIVPDTIEMWLRHDTR
jgi:hypothetical protein